MSLWSWLWTQESGGVPTAAEVAADAAYAHDLSERAKELCHRMGIFDELNGQIVPLQWTHLLNVPLLEHMLQRIEDLERVNGGREHLRALRDWPKEKGDG